MNRQKIKQQILAFPGNGPVLEDLCNLLETGEAVALVGGGASAGLWPQWDEFLQGLIGYTRQYGKITPVETRFFQQESSQTPLETIQQLHNKIGDSLYYEYLSKTFSYKTSPQTACAFTTAQQSLMQLPIQNYLALNYDAGLNNAREHLYPEATSSYYFWDQEEARNILETGGYKRLILHAHGRYDRPDSILLALDDCRRAYSYTPFVRLLNSLFDLKKLIMVGLNWKDPYVKQLFDNISGDYKNSFQRHIALVGLEDDELESIELLRERVEMVYGSKILFYPSRNNHATLAVWLNALVDRYALHKGWRSAGKVEPIKVSILAQTLADRYIHNPTDDENFEGREQDIITLNRWGNDPATRIMAVTGIGGQGKTSLVGHWLKRMRKSELTKMPVFYWSFYEDLDAGKFLAELTRFLKPIVKTNVSQEKDPISFLMEAAGQARLLVVLDGLEVLQEAADSPAHGRILDPLLQQMFQQWVHYKHQSLMVLTSRFTFPQLNRYRGALFHHLSLTRLSPQNGVSLLKKLGIHGKPEILAEYVEKLYGHPLALKVLAAAVKRFCGGHLDSFGGEHILTVDTKDELGWKLKHMLGFYEKQLKNGQKELLGIVSLFKRPVDAKSFVALLGRMESLKNTPLAGADETAIREQIKTLTADFLVEETREGLTCHPVIRDYFRNEFKLAGSRREVADFLQKQPGGDKPQNIEEVRDLVEAIQLLCEEGEFKTANDLRTSRLTLTNGYNVFIDLPAPVEGLECALAFIGDAGRQKGVEAALGKIMVAVCMSGASHYNYHLGNLPQSLEWRHKSLEIFRLLENTRPPIMSLLEISRIEKAMGDIHQARKAVSQALAMLQENEYLEDLIVGLVYDANYDSLLGDIIGTVYSFELALLCERQQNGRADYLSGEGGNLQAEFFIRIKDWEQFEKTNAWNIESCKENHWNVYLAICHLLQGWYEIRQGRLSPAEKALDQVDRILRPTRLLKELSRLEWAWALLAEARGDYREGLRRVEESLVVCTDKGFNLQQADGLCLRGRLSQLKFRQEGQKDTDLLDKAGDDGHKALKIAEDRGYVWAKIEALELLYAYHQAKAALPATDSRTEQEQARRYLREAEAERDKLNLTEEIVQRIKDDARQAFEAQIAGKLK